MARNRTTQDAGTSFFRRFFIPLLWSIALLGFLLRLGTAIEFSGINGGANNMLSPPSVSDLRTYITLGSEIARGIFPKEFYYQPFYYAVFLPVIYLLSGTSLWAVAVIQCVLGGFTVLFAGLTARELFGRIAGVLAAFFTAISTPLLLYAPFHQNETLQAFNLTLLFFLFLKALRKKNLSYWALTGLMAGIALLTRGNALLFLPLFLAGLWLMKRVSIRRKGLLTLVFLVCFVAPQIPFIVRNTAAKGRLTGPSTAADAVLALGNTPEAPPGGRNAGLPAGPMEYPPSFHSWMAKAAKDVSVPRQMFNWMCREPGAFFELQFRKLLLFWDGRELPNNVSLYGEGKYSLLLKLLLPGRSHLLLALALAGMFLFAGKSFSSGMRRRGYLYIFCVIYWGAVALFYILSRFRAPIIPLTQVFAGAFIACHILRWKKWERNRKILGLLCLAAGAFFTVRAYDLYADNLEPALMRAFRPAGTVTETGIIDNGPFTCGAWTPAELPSGTRIGKKIAAPADRRGNWKWHVFSPEEGTLIVKVDGSEKILSLVSGMNELSFAGPAEIEIEVVSAPQGCAAVFDARRDYGRSTLNGRKLRGEWVMRFTL